MPLRHNNLPGRHFSRGGLVRHRLRHVGDPHVYKLTATEALGVGGATLIVILLCLLLLSKACTDTVSPHLTGDGDKAPAPGVLSLTMQGDAGADPGFVLVSRLPSFPWLVRNEIGRQPPLL